jgi:GT2 family glycosyltransferase/glycosyltransferase involved in cell wall biosynthesis
MDKNTTERLEISRDSTQHAIPRSGRRSIDDLRQGFGAFLAGTAVTMLRRLLRWARAGRMLLAARELARLAFWLVGPAAANRALSARVIARSGLFDASYYLATYSDVRASPYDPLMHYIRWGAPEGRTPSPLFDPTYYRGQLKRGLCRRMNPLEHYILFGWRRRLDPHPWFGARFYLAENRDVARSRQEPLRHFLTEGWRQKRSPVPNFDTRAYLDAYPDVARLDVNPLLHFLDIGQAEGRQPAPERGAGAWLPRAGLSPLRPASEEWDMVATGDPQRSAGAPSVDVIVPVYRGIDETLRCLFQVRSTVGSTPFELIVIDDAGPEPELASALDGLAAAGHITLVRNERNLGFVATANRGMALHPDRDVVLLNSDTEVYGDWLDRLRRTAHAQSDIATVTPFSNNATICSYPRTATDNPHPLELGFEALDALAAEVNAGKTVDLPTAIGFCMYIRRDALDAVGLFDVETFGRGYGEENDFCLRAAASGWRHVLATDVFVRHWGDVSFRGEKPARLIEAMRIIGERYPHYHGAVRAHIAADPAAPMRLALDLARLRAMARHDSVLIVSHGRGGGTEQHVRERVAALAATGCGVFRLGPDPRGGARLRLFHPRVDTLPNLPPIDMTAGVESLAGLCRAVGITRIEVHHIIDMPDVAPAYLADLARALGIPFDIVVHDYTAICPRINLVDGRGRFCGEPAEAVCDRCIVMNGSPFGLVRIRPWRAAQAAFFAAADTVVVPDEDVRDRLQRYLPGRSFVVRPHEPELAPAPARAVPLEARQRLRIGVIGAIGQIKGFDVLRAAAADARKRRLPLTYVVVGYSANDVSLHKLDVEITGRYHNDDVLALIDSLGLHALWVPSVWPETYSYTLSIALRTGLPIAAFDLGAVAARLRRLGLGTLMPVAGMHDPVAINAAFLAMRDAAMQSAIA